MELKLRKAGEEDVVQIAWLYHRIYQGKYPSPMISNFSLLSSFLKDPANLWLVAESNQKIVASVVYSIDFKNSLAKAFGAVVDPSVRGNNLTLKLLELGYEELTKRQPVDLVYALTRTVHDAAQRVIENLGYRKLGVFPNVHKAESYETHCLAALYSPGAMATRSANYRIHHKLKNLSDIVCGELDLPLLEPLIPQETSRQLLEPPKLELVDASQLVKHRYEQCKSAGSLRFEFHAFNEPNVMLTTPDQEIEIFVMREVSDGHCEVVGVKIPENIAYTPTFINMAEILRDGGARYIEMGIEASRPKIVESFLRAKFVPCAFFPAFQKEGSTRVDYVVLSRTFENLDFQSLQFRGLNQKFIEEYFRNWRDMAMPPRLHLESP